MLDLLDELREFPDSETAGRTRALIVRATPRFAFALDPRNRSYYLDPREITGGVVAAAGTIVELTPTEVSDGRLRGADVRNCEEMNQPQRISGMTGALGAVHG
jgi:hypothetical protein